MLKIIATFSVIAIISGCSSEDSSPLGKAKKIRAQMVCPLPAGLVEHTPLLEFSATDSAREKLFREYIEIERRKPITEGNWKLAATMVYTTESLASTYKATMQNDAEKLDSWLKNYEKGMELFKDPIDEIAVKELEIYKGFCKSHLEYAQSFAEREIQLENLRKESKQPWLDPKKPLPCPVQQKPGCTR